MAHGVIRDRKGGGRSIDLACSRIADVRHQTRGEQADGLLSSMAHRSWTPHRRRWGINRSKQEIRAALSMADAAESFFGYIRAINARQQSVKIRQSSLKRTEPLQDLGVVKPADGRIACVGESPRADVMRLPRHLLRTADRGLGTQALNRIVGKDGAVITPRYRRRKVVDRAFAHSESIPYCGEQQKNRRRVRRSATAYRRQHLQNGP